MPSNCISYIYGWSQQTLVTATDDNHIFIMSAMKTFRSNCPVTLRNLIKTKQWLSTKCINAPKLHTCTPCRQVDNAIPCEQTTQLHTCTPCRQVDNAIPCEQTSLYYTSHQESCQHHWHKLLSAHPVNNVTMTHMITVYQPVVISYLYKLCRWK